MVAWPFIVMASLSAWRYLLMLFWSWRNREGIADIHHFGVGRHSIKHLEVQVRKDARARAVAGFVEAWKAADGGGPVELSDRLYFADRASVAVVFTPRPVALLDDLRREPASGRSSGGGAATRRTSTPMGRRSSPWA